MDTEGPADTPRTGPKHTAAPMRGEGEKEHLEHTINSTSRDEHATMLRIREQESFAFEAKWLMIHGFRSGMTDEQILHAANTLCANMQLQMNNTDILEAMEQMTGWQINEADGNFGICVELTETPTFITSYDYDMDPTVQPSYSTRFGPNMLEEEGREQRIKFHVQASDKPPAFYKHGLKELVVFRGATTNEEYSRTWLHTITEYCKHQFAWPHVVLMRTASNKTPTYDPTATRPGDKMQYLKEPIATLYCVKTNHKEESTLKAEVMTHFRLKGTDSDYNQYMTIQGLHYELIPTADHLRITAPMNPSSRVLSPKNIYVTITGITRGSRPFDVIQILVATGHISLVGYLNHVYKPGALDPIPGVHNPRNFRQYSAGLILITEHDAEPIIKDPSPQYADLQEISTRTRSGAVSLTFKITPLIYGMQKTREIMESAYRARFPMGNVQKGVDLSPKAWSTPPSSTATSVSTMSTMDNERLTQNELAVTSFQNVAKLITQRLDNFENSAFLQQTQLTDIARAQQTNFDDLTKAIAEANKRTDGLQALADANKKTNDQLLAGMTALLQQNQRLLVNNGLN